MKSLSVFSKILKLGLTLLLAQTSLANADEIKVFSTIGVRSVVQELSPQFERATGHKLVLSFDVANALKRRIEAGESFDLAILTAPVMDDLIKQGKIVADTRVIVARGGMGLAVRSGAQRCAQA